VDLLFRLERIEQSNDSFKFVLPRDLNLFMTICVFPENNPARKTFGILGRNERVLGQYEIRQVDFREQ
jgi:hypothetical protein